MSSNSSSDLSFTGFMSQDGDIKMHPQTPNILTNDLLRNHVDEETQLIPYIHDYENVTQSLEETPESKQNVVL